MGGIGNRYLDNLRVNQTGHLVHMDLGWVFKKNPTASKMRITQKMYTALGDPTRDPTRRGHDVIHNEMRKFHDHWEIIMCFMQLLRYLPDPKVTILFVLERLCAFDVTLELEEWKQD